MSFAMAELHRQLSVIIERRKASVTTSDVRYWFTKEQEMRDAIGRFTIKFHDQEQHPHR